MKSENKKITILNQKVSSGLDLMREISKIDLVQKKFVYFHFKREDLSKKN